MAFPTTFLASGYISCYLSGYNLSLNLTSLRFISYIPPQICPSHPESGDCYTRSRANPLSPKPPPSPLPPNYLLINPVSTDPNGWRGKRLAQKESQSNLWFYRRLVLPRLQTRTDALARKL
ncbi:hypothetical protein ETB97_008000 [Aspergillus alliaceus]|uniref:Uncharacterized protein n=1 Tax=Petromyces alliaceus TaxID=209559 RepID=A0A8H6E2N7_PETAA|nr:hypothetical protein ETB97_008000 [Aspergillus burnettii]